MSDKPSIDRSTYWRKQRIRIGVLLGVWFVVGYLMSIFFIEPLNALELGEMPFGFWMAQQGSIFVFVGLILVFAVISRTLDEQAGVVEEERER